MPSNPTTVLSSTSVGNSAVVALDWMAGGPTTVRVTAGGTTSSLAVATGRVEWTLDDTLTVPSSLVVWTGLSTTGALNSTASGFISATAVNLADGFGLGYQIQSPVAALRFHTTAWTTLGFVMQVMQGRGW
jgi:hypothetical protein